MTLTISRPRRSFIPVLDEMDKMIDRMFRDSYDSRDESSSWMPPVDIVENKDEIMVRADVPGLEKDNFKVSVEDSVLTISGEKKVEYDEKDKENSFHRSERVYGSFSRSFTLPNNVDTGSVKAKYRNGVLQVAISKLEESKPKQIDIDVS